MTEPVPDRDLLSEFTERRSESAFQTLVQRHTDLVFATALRRMGDAAAAQDVTQEVFITLARKAVWLRGEASLAGWLYKTALFQSRRWWRGESRHRRREQTAMELNTTMKADDSPGKSLAGVLDEGLLELREPERQALLLRFFEQRNHREVGRALGIGEDAARKRVDKGLGQLTRFFQKRGYAVGTTAVAAAALNAAALTAPAGLATIAAQAALTHAGVGAASWLTLWLARLLRPSKAEAAVLCVAALLVPAVWQGARWRSATDEQRRMVALLSALQAQREGVAHEQTQLDRQLRRTANRLAQLHVLSGYTALLTEANLDPRLFRWDEAANYVRVPKAVLRWLTFEESTLSSHGSRISPTLLGALGLSAEEQARMQQFCQSEMDAYHTFVHSRSYFTNLPTPGPTQSFVKLTEDSRAWVTPALSPDESGGWRRRFSQGLTNLFGAERTGIVLGNASDDGSLSVCFQQFGAEDLIIAVTPWPEGGCTVSKQVHSGDGKPLWKGSQTIALSLATGPPPAEPPKPSAPAAYEFWRVLNSRPLPAALADYLRQWTAAHPDVPDQPRTTP